MKNECKTCKAKCEGEYCFRHKPRKPIPKSRAENKSPILRKNAKKMSSLFTKKLDNSSHNSLKMNEFFMTIWNKKPHRSEISGISLGKEPLTIFFHHILPKEKYPQACFDEENIILLTWEEHDQVEMDIYRYDKINEQRNYLKTKYNL
jgi:hypothetical protein